MPFPFEFTRKKDMFTSLFFRLWPPASAGSFLSTHRSNARDSLPECPTGTLFGKLPPPWCW
jgi:hypothetical protein